MAGLLDFLAADGGLGVGLLAAAQSGQGFGPGLLQAVQYANANKQQSKRNSWEDQDRETEQRYRNAQIADLQRKAERDQRVQGLLGAALGGGMPGVAGPNEPVSQQSARQGGNLANLSADQIAALKVSGVDLTDIWKEARPSYQVANNYAYDPRTVGPGFLPGVQFGQDGRANAIRPSADRGTVEVQIPRGAAEAYGTYRGIDAGITAANTPERVYNPATGREEFVPRSEVIRRPSMNPVQNKSFSGAGYAGGSSDSAAPDQVRIIQEELNRLPADHKDRPALTRELQRLGAGAASGNFAAGPSANEAANAAAERARQIKQAEADVQPTDQRASGLSAANDMLKVLGDLQSHPGRATATGLSGTIDPRNYIPGTNARDFNVALDQLRGKTFLQAFESLKGGGQITEVEGKKATDAIARLNTAQSDAAFEKALQDLTGIVQGSMQRQRGSAQRSGVTGSWDAPAEQAAQPRATMRYNPQTGRVEKVN